VELPQKTLSFGNVFCGEEETRTFAVVNPHDTPITVTFDLGEHVRQLLRQSSFTAITLSHL
jgi:hypothetical protein